MGSWLINIIFNITGFYLIYLVIKQISKHFSTKMETFHNRRTMLEEICEIARSNGGFRLMHAKVSQDGSRTSEIEIYRYSGEIVRYVFRDHGFENLEYFGMDKLFNQLKTIFHGSISNEWTGSSGSYYGNGSISYISSSITPGGGTGYTVHTTDEGDYRDSLGVLCGFTLYSAEETMKHRREADLKALREKEEKERYRKSF